MNREILGLASILLVVGLLTACATTSDETATDDHATTAEIAVYEIPPDWGSNAGRAEGVLVEVDGCVRLDNGRVPIFPHEQVTWDGETLTFGGEQYRLGDTIHFAGNELGEPNDLEIDMPGGCSAGPFWIVGPHRQ